MNTLLKKYNLQLGAVLATVITFAIIPARISEGQGANVVSLIGSEILIWLMCLSIWLSSYQTYYKLNLAKWQKIAVGLLVGAAISNLYFLASFRFFEDYPPKSMRDLSLSMVVVRLSLRGLLLGLVMIPIIFLLETERERQEEELKRERNRTIDAERQKEILEALVSERTVELEESLAILGESQEELEHQIYLLTRVVASIAHDVHAPLKFIVSATEYTGKLIDSKQLEQATEYNQQVERGLGNMVTFMQNLLEFARGQIHRGALHLVPVNLSALVQEKARLFEQILHSRGNHLRLSLNQHLTVISNANLLGVILHNLLDNATKNTKNNEIRIYADIIDNRLNLYIQNPLKASAGPSRAGERELLKQQTVDFERDAGLGLILVRDIAALLNVDFLIEAVDNTVIARITFPEFSRE